MKNIRQYLTGLLLVTICFSVTGQDDGSENTLSAKEKKKGWVLMFDGKTFTGWMNARTGEFPSSGWEIREGALRVIPDVEGARDIVSKGRYRNFELSIDFLYTSGANSGIKYFIDTERNNGTMASLGCEYQIIDDLVHPDAKLGINGNRKLASVYDIMPPQNIKDNGVGKWNNARIIVRGNKVEHWLNGQKTLEYEKGSRQWTEMIASSKFKNTKGFAEVEQGRILLQYHGDEVRFRNIKIRELK